MRESFVWWVNLLNTSCHLYTLSCQQLYLVQWLINSSSCSEDQLKQQFLLECLDWLSLIGDPNITVSPLCYHLLATILRPV